MQDNTNNDGDNNNDQVKSMNGKFMCTECQNENELTDSEEGAVVECGFCGLEYEVVSKDEDGTCVLQILEEEK